MADVDTSPGTTPADPPPNAPVEGSKNDAEEQRENSRSAVRVIVTYMAAGFLFIVGSAVVGYFLATQPDKTTGKDIFLAILPVAAAIVTYWFATRRNEAMKSDDLVKIIEAARNTK
ncbi:MAG: hypothetical protein OXI64_09490 [Defluviicoccus sp.]|nr:hypothetical protein [Defluviicoccus sp.]